MLFRGVAAVVGVVLATSALAGCGPDDPAPTPTPLFATEEEAFAAAEATYRAYIDALNSGEATTDPARWLSGEALVDTVEVNESLASRGISTVGDVEVLLFRGESLVEIEHVTFIAAQVCLELTHARLVDEAGKDVTPRERPDLSGFLVEMRAQDGMFSIATSSLDGEACSGL